jgi:glyoxylase-like metal-dependent hydrolase (beta-lactamase superfamily II)
MHPAEEQILPSRHAGEHLDDERNLLLRNGAPVDEVPDMVADPEAMQAFRGMVDATRLIEDGELLPLTGRRVRAVWTPGHTPGHLCLHDEDRDLLLTGDCVLPRITPNVGLQHSSAPPPLAPYLESLQKLKAYPTVEVLPAHEWRFRGLVPRLDDLIEHHRKRCQEILDVLAQGPLTTWQVTERLTWSRGWENVHGFQRRAALAETLSHLVYLADLGKVTRPRTDSGTGAVGEWSL